MSGATPAPRPTVEERFATLVGVACHDLRTPLATVSGFAKTLTRTGELGERDGRFVGMIDEAAGQMIVLLDQLGLATRIASGRYDPPLGSADTLELAASSGDARIAVEGAGAVLETDPAAAGGALAALAAAALRFGEVPAVTWSVSGRELTLRPLTAAAAPVVTGSSPSDLGALVARVVIERLGGVIEVEGGALRVRM